MSGDCLVTQRLTVNNRAGSRRGRSASRRSVKHPRARGARSWRPAPAPRGAPAEALGGRARPAAAGRLRRARGSGGDLHSGRARRRRGFEIGERQAAQPAAFRERLAQLRDLACWRRSPVNSRRQAAAHARRRASRLLEGILAADILVGADDIAASADHPAAGRSRREAAGADARPGACFRSRRRGAIAVTLRLTSAGQHRRADQRHAEQTMRQSAAGPSASDARIAHAVADFAGRISRDLRSAAPSPIAPVRAVLLLFEHREHLLDLFDVGFRRRASSAVRKVPAGVAAGAPCSRRGRCRAAPATSPPPAPGRSRITAMIELSRRLGAELEAHLALSPRGACGHLSHRCSRLVCGGISLGIEVAAVAHRRSGGALSGEDIGRQGQAGSPRTSDDWTRRSRRRCPPTEKVPTMKSTSPSQPRASYTPRPLGPKYPIECASLRSAPSPCFGDLDHPGAGRCRRSSNRHPPAPPSLSASGASGRGACRGPSRQSGGSGRSSA